MKSLKVWILLVLALPLMAAACEKEERDKIIYSLPAKAEKVKKAADDLPKYAEGAVDVYKEFNEVDTSGSTLEDIKNYVDAGAAAAGTVGATVPGAQGYAGVATLVLTGISTVLGIIVAKKSKEARSERDRADKNGRIADNYREGIEAGRMYGEDEEVVDVHVLRERLDKETKEHNNAEGHTKL